MPHAATQTGRRNERPAELPILHMNKGELNDFFCICAELDALEAYAENHSARLKAIPGGWRDMRMMMAVMDKLVRNIRQTIPPEKRAGVDLTSRHIQYKLKLGKSAAQEQDAMLMSLQTLDALVLSAHEYRCRLCGKATCAGCPLCRALDNVLAFDRNGGSWATIDIREAM